MKIILTLISLVVSLPLIAQAQAEYAGFIAKAEAHYTAGEYAKSAKEYASAFNSSNGKGYVTDRYNAACSYALSSQIDSAFVQLMKIATKGNYTHYNHLISDPDLNSLYDDARWEEVKILVKANKDKEEEHLDKPLVAKLDTIYREDQKYRMQIDAIEKEHGWESPEMQSMVSTIMQKDAINLVKVKQILDEHGWLGPDIIGRQGNSTLFLVIQHADIETQKKYLPMMRDAVEKGNAKASSLALLEDRVALRSGELQIYGSQIGRDEETGESYVLPMQNPDQVDIRRKSVGLGPLSEYTVRFGFEWDVETYKKELPKYIEIQKKEHRHD